MASFVALNVEPEEDSAEEIDDTKEIQIEEALKLYQNALKLHSQGPLFFDAAKAAYDALFSSEIFTYPESLSESKRFEIYGDAALEDEDEETSLVTEPIGPAGGTDVAPNTLPKILYLSFKNHGQLLLDRLAYQINSSKNGPRTAVEEMQGDRKATARTVVKLFTEALEWDDTDIDLWRRTSRISALLESQRISRFCLEAVIDNETEDETFSEPLGLEGTVALDELTDIVKTIDDRFSQSQLPDVLNEPYVIPEEYRERMDICPQLPKSSITISRVEAIRRENPIGNIAIPLQTWACVGTFVLQHLGSTPPALGMSYTISLPGNFTALATGPGRINLIATSSRRSLSSGTSSARKDLETGTISYGEPKPVSCARGSINKGSQDGLNTNRVAGVKNTTFRANPATSGDTEKEYFRKDLADSEITCSVPLVSPEGPPRTMAGNVTLPTRKRTLDSSGVQELGDGGRVRSKRIRAKAELPDEENTAAELATYYEEQLQANNQADHWIFEHTNGLLSKLGVHPMGTSEELRQKPENLSPGEQLEMSVGGLEAAMRDFRNVLNVWYIDKSNIWNSNCQEEEQLDGGESSGLALFLEYSKRGIRKTTTRPLLSGDDGLSDFVRDINQSWNGVDVISFRWLTELLSPKHTVFPADHGLQPLVIVQSLSTYNNYLWPDELKETVVQMLIVQDEICFDILKSQLKRLNQQILLFEQNPQQEQYLERIALVGMIQTIFEMHLDVYGRITNPSSQVNQATRTIQEDRLQRWTALASQAITSKGSAYNSEEEPPNGLGFRHLWSIVIHMILTNAASRDHIILCFEDLRTHLKVAGSPIIELQNNAVMPEISVPAADREISKLATMDFFLKIFNRESPDSLTVIKNLEPILINFDPECCPNGEGNREDDITGQDPYSPGCKAKLSQLWKAPADPQMQQKTEFIEKASISLKLFLWRRLRAAYEAINYPPMVFLCNMSSIELILREIRSSTYSNETPENRMADLLRWLCSLENLVARSLALAIGGSTAFDCMDEHHMRISMQSCADLIKLMHTVALWDDSIRVGQSFAPLQPSGSASTAYSIIMRNIRVMHVRTWMLQYKILKEAMSQNADSFTTPKEDLADYLKWVHHALGMRKYCGLSKKAFLLFMKDELSSLNASENWEDDMAQVIYDLYGLKICPNFLGLQDHGCIADGLDRTTAVDLMDIVMEQARDMPIKDLLKSDLKLTIDKMQSAILSPRQTSTQLFNKRLIVSYLKAPINPVDLYRSLRGIGSLSGRMLNNEHSLIVSKGWYFILGYINFTKFRSQKRPGPTDDLDFAITFFKMDLEYDTEKWETWYRLAQAYDAMIEEDSTWSADKLDRSREDLNALQRNAIHCYAMAVAVAIRCANASFDTAGKISDLYTDFGNRMYGSSRGPFSMEVFSLDEYKRYFSGEIMYQNRPFRDLKLYSAWKFATVLFRQALIDKPERWINWYMLGKCLWKMHSNPDQKQSVDYREVLDAFGKAIECVPERRDSRHPDKDPILEPHYKLVSIVHKLVQRRLIMPAEGCRYLDATPYSRKVPHVQDSDDWEGYMLLVLKSLRSADKSNWHHRMVARAAHVIYDDSSTDNMAARAAKHELTQQIFTKTMAVQVWKPENERVGRHFVYTGRYVAFFVQLLSQLGDRASLEALAKRIRKKSGDFVNFARIWQVVCVAYLKLLRNQNSIPEAHEEIVFKSISHESFLLNTARLEAWALTPDADTPILHLLREIIELKKLNSHLMKTTLIDDLVGDTFALLYETILPDLISKSNDEENRDRMRVDHLLMHTEASPTATNAPCPAPPPPPGQGSTEQPATTRARPKGVGRRDIQRKAELLVSRSAVPAPTTSAFSSSKAAKPPTSVPTALQPPDIVLPTDAAPDEGVAREKETSSVPGSVHDSADDESELSDIEEEALGMVMMGDQKPMFPGLLGRAEAEAEAEAGGESEEEGEEGEGEGEEDDDGSGGKECEPGNEDEEQGEGMG